MVLTHSNIHFQIKLYHLFFRVFSFVLRQILRFLSVVCVLGVHINGGDKDIKSTALMRQRIKEQFILQLYTFLLVRTLLVRIPNKKRKDKKNKMFII